MRPDIHYVCDPPRARLCVSGELDIATEDQLTGIFRYLADRGCTTIEVDLGAITFIDAYSLGVLHREQRRLLAAGGDLSVVAGSLYYNLVSGLARYDTLQVSRAPLAPDAA